MSTEQNKVTHSAAERLTGRVKWFNNKAGYGFITVTDGYRSGSDFFVHHSAINVESQQYKYLVQGEYVQFDLVKTNSQTHEWQASMVAGINGGKLMCETRQDLKLARSEYKSTKQQPETVAEPKMPRQKAPRETVPREVSRQKKSHMPRTNSQEPKDTVESNEWTLAGPPKRRGRPPRKQTNVTTA
jgi:CspA family cold shock protein